MKNIFFDLDGTLINSQVRLYNLFCKLCPENTFSYEEYWDIKRNHITQKDFLRKYFNYNDVQIENFRKRWFEEVEKEQIISQDVPVDGIVDVIKKLSSKNDLYLVTHRQDKNLTENQLKKLGWYGFFKKILVTEQKISKIDIIKNEVDILKDGFVIGDTGEDIKTAQALGLKSIAVTWGVMNKKILKSYNPDFIFDDVDDFYREVIL